MRKIITLLMTMVMVLGMSTAVLASGDGSGSGNGEFNTLNEASVFESDDTSATVYVVFEKNISNMEVKDNNMKAFNVVDANGQAVDFEVSMWDDQVDRDMRETVAIACTGLAADETYTIEVSKDVTSKSGNSLESDMIVEFNLTEVTEIHSVGGSAESGLSAGMIVAIIGGAIVVIGIIGLIIAKRKK